MKDKIFELVTKGYEVSFRPDNTLSRGVVINLRKKNYQNNVIIDRVLGPENDMLLWTLDRLEKSFGDHSEPVTFGERKMALIRMEYPKNMYLERYFDAHKIRYKASRDPYDYFNHVAIRYECELTEVEFEELHTFLDIIR